MNGSELKHADVSRRARSLDALDHAVARARAALTDAIAASQNPAEQLAISAEEIRRALVHAHRQLRDAEREAFAVLDQLDQLAGPPVCGGAGPTLAIAHVGAQP